MWPFQKDETKGKKPGLGSELPEDFAEAARRVVAEVETGPAAAREEVRQVGEPEVFVIEDDYARELIRWCFQPMGRKDPRWYLTEEEAGRASPKVRAAIQDLADRIIPAALGRLAERNKKVFEAVVAMGALYWFKHRQIRALEQEAEKRRAERRVERMEERGKTVDTKPVTCEVCQVEFPNMEACAAHLPCKPKKEAEGGNEAAATSPTE